jgi:hypothetical protein
MSEYEGLNLAQLMDRMHDLVVPDPVSYMPETIGWWVFCLWILATTTLVCVHRIIRYRRGRYRREALSMLDEIEKTRAWDGQAAEIATLVKRVALAAYDRKNVADLYGERWAAFLIESSNGDLLVAEGADLIARAAYANDLNPLLLYEPVKRWIVCHHV